MTSTSVAGVAVDLSRTQAEAAAAADAAGIAVVEVDTEQATRLVADAGDLVWGPRGTFAPNELRALSFAGNPVHVALDRRRRDRPVVGFAVGFLGWSPALHVHSHQAGVVPGHRRRGIGYALKLAQRHTCAAHGILEMRWTFDPLIRRNTTFNLAALGARAASFHPNFYGAMSDSINSGDESDRLQAVWDLTRPLPSRDLGRGPVARGGDGPVLLSTSGVGPVLHDRRPVPGAVMDVPADFEAMRADDPAVAAAWRTAVRRVLVAAYDAGLCVDAVDDRGYRFDAARTA